MDKCFEALFFDVNDFNIDRGTVVTLKTEYCVESRAFYAAGRTLSAANHTCIVWPQISCKQPTLELFQCGLEHSECCLLANFIDLWDLACLLERQSVQLLDAVPDAKYSLLCSTTAWTVDWESMIASLGA